MTDTQERIDALAKRLEDGFIKIGAAMAEGQRVGDWEKLWIDLLREYERLNDEMAVHEAEPAPVVQASMELGRIEVAAA